MKRIYSRLFTLLVAVALFYLVSQLSAPPPKTAKKLVSPVPATALPTQPATSAAVLGVATLSARIKTADCKVNGPFPDKDCTPGAVFPDATREQVCVVGYTKTVRNVSESVKNEVYKEYGITSHMAGEYEVDHHISLELGGSNDISNLWPEAADPTPGFHQKDVVENYLHKQVCDGVITLQQAQSEIANDWMKVYNSMQ